MPISLVVEIEADPDYLPAKADPLQIKRALKNIIINARDAMPDGGTITLKLARLNLNAADVAPCPQLPPGIYIALTVTDTGEGISPADMPYIFEPFFTTKELGQGAGLGLAQVSGIVKQHHGFIDVTSCPGELTTFTLYLPALLPHDMPLDQAPSARQPDSVLCYRQAA
jgi:signal transduction histidine kinase